MAIDLPAIWTLGHSTRTIGEFLELLGRNQIEILADVRHFPGSRRFPHFNKPELAKSLSAAGIGYEHLVELGGRRAVKADSQNLQWRNASFRGYADYMETQGYREGVDRLLKIAGRGRAAIMCSEAVWWRCHRSMISDDLKAKGVRVLHILDDQKVQEHPYTPAARVVDGKPSYKSLPEDNESLFQEIEAMTRDFKVGDHVEWNSEAGRVGGTIQKRITSRFTFKGYTVHASKEEPQYLIKSDKTDHMAMHKGSALTLIEETKQ